MTLEQPVFETPVHVGRPNIANPELFLQLVEGAMERHWLSNNGPLVQELERKIETYLGVRHCIALTNGTAALEILIKSLELSGEVIVPSWTFIATVHSLKWLGLEPVFADVDPETQCLDPESVRSLISERTSAILGVHLWGQVAPVGELTELAREFGLKLIFDAAHAFGVSSSGRMVGSFGEAEVLSFHATKFFNAIEGGAIVTNSDSIAERARLMRNFGFKAEDCVVELGINAKMTEVSAAMGISNFENLQGLIESNKRNFESYLKATRDIPGVGILRVDSNSESNYQYVVLLVHHDCPVTRDLLLEKLKLNNILARRYFWPGCHNMEPYATEQPLARRALPITERVSKEVIVLPTGTSVSQDDIEKIVGVIRSTVMGGA